MERDGALIMLDDDRMPLRSDETPLMQKVRFRTPGCYPLTGAIESEADTDTVAAIIRELLLTRHSERQGRVIDHDAKASMEKKKQDGFFDGGSGVFGGGEAARVHRAGQKTQLASMAR